MLGFQIFHNIYLNLSLKGKNSFLGNVFGVDDVSVSDFLIMESKVIIRLFSQNVFYQFVFLFDDGQSVVTVDDRIVKGKIFVLDDSCKDFNLFIYLLAQCSCEKDVYQLISQSL